MKVLVVAPHPDDEILGCGGTIARFVAEGHEVYVVIVTKAGPPLFSVELVEKGRQEALAAHQFLGVKETLFCDLPAAQIDTLAHCEVNQALSRIVMQVEPDWVFVPFWGDIHLDHQAIFLSSLVAVRPNRAQYPRKICAYEVLSETNWHAPFAHSGFQPNMFIDISGFLQKKIQAFSLYQSQVQAFPHERSVKALEALATLRGSTIHREAAEAFVLIREVV